MAFVYEINGQRVEFDQEPTDADIDEAAASLGSAPSQTTSGVEQVGPQLASAARYAGSIDPADLAAVARPGIDAVKGVGKLAAASAQDLYKMGQIATHVTPGVVYDYLQHPIENTFRNYVDPVTGAATKQPGLIKSYVEGHPWAQKLSGSSVASLANDAGQYAKTVGPEMLSGAKNLGARVGSGLVQGVLAPESSFLMPYQMAAHEQEKIQQNPTAPQYQNNPYAQTYRGEAATQGRAGAANQMRAVANMPYGNVSAQERAILDEDARIKEAIRKKALEKVMGPVAPGSF